MQESGGPSYPLVQGGTITFQGATSPPEATQDRPAPRYQAPLQITQALLPNVKRLFRLLYLFLVSIIIS
jgi:hypothetical protein